MKTAKEEALALVSELPDDVDFREIARIMLLRSHILRSRDQALRGELIPHDEVMQDLRNWQLSTGRQQPEAI